jgi:hypothetical protein
MLRRKIKILGIWDVCVQQVLNILRNWERKVEDVGRGIFQVWIKTVNFNPTNISLRINLQTPQTYTFQFFTPHKHTPTNPKCIPYPNKPMLNPNNVLSVINKNLYT